MAAITNWWRGTEIHRAASAGELNKILKHIESNSDLDVKDPEKHTPLSLAAKFGHARIVEKLLGTGRRVNPDSKNQHGQTPLFLAAANGHDQVVRHLKDHSKVDINAKDQKSETALSQASKNGHHTVVKDLLASPRIEPDTCNDNSRTALSQASQAGRLEVVKQFSLDGKVDFNAADSQSDTALSLAARAGHADVVKELLATNKVNPNTKNAAGQTPLSLAAESGQVQVVKQLLRDIRIDVNSRDNNLMTPLLHAVQGGHVEVIQKLLASGAVASLASSYGQAAQDIVREKLVSSTNKQDQQLYRDIKSILEAPPAITRRGSSQGSLGNIMSVVETAVWPPDSSSRRRGICESFQARVEFHRQGSLGGFQPWITPVWDLVYGDSLPPDLVTWKRTFADWKWIHLPANNVSVPIALCIVNVD
jgi:ankyrin repeat protein